MIFLTESQKDAIGLTFVLNELQADSPYGAMLIRQVGFFAQKQKQELLNEFHNITQILAYTHAESEKLSDLRRLLMRFNDISNILKKLESYPLHEIELFELKSFLLNLNKLRVALHASAAKLKLVDIELVDMEQTLNILDPEKKRIAPFYLGEYHSKELWDVRQDKSRIEGLLRKETDKATLDALKKQRLLIVAREEAAEMAVKEDLAQRLRVFLSSFKHNLGIIGKLDFTIQKALLAKRYGAVCPDLGGDVLQLVEMINPAVDSLLKEKGKLFTPVSIVMRSGVTMLTGANMGGKSVAIRTMVLNICLCLMGFFVFATKAKIPLFDGIYLLAEDLQSVDNGLSTFGAEVVCLDNIAQLARTSFIFIALDEFARGTNPQEGALIVRAVARYLDSLQSMTIITTHYDNVVDETFAHYQVAGLKNLDFQRLSERIANGATTGVALIAVHMDYSLHKVHGQVEPARDALNICKLLGLDDEILAVIEEEILQKK